MIAPTYKWNGKGIQTDLSFQKLSLAFKIPFIDSGFHIVAYLIIHPNSAFQGCLVMIWIWDRHGRYICSVRSTQIFKSEKTHDSNYVFNRTLWLLCEHWGGKCRSKGQLACYHKKTRQAWIRGWPLSLSQMMKTKEPV
jgi:hypothetical protein